MRIVNLVMNVYEFGYTSRLVKSAVIEKTIFPPVILQTYFEHIDLSVISPNIYDFLMQGSTLTALDLPRQRSSPYTFCTHRRL
jgi:hypothetical protein